MDLNTEAVIRKLDDWCCKGRVALENRDIPAKVEEFKMHMGEELEGLQLIHDDARLTETLVCLDYWCRQRGAFSKLYPKADPCTAKDAKRWFMTRTGYLLGKIRPI